MDKGGSVSTGRWYALNETVPFKQRYGVPLGTSFSSRSYPILHAGAENSHSRSAQRRECFFCRLLERPLRIGVFLANR
jgi:hypothetical protein